MTVSGGRGGGGGSPKKKKKKHTLAPCICFLSEAATRDLDTVCVVIKIIHGRG